MRLLTANKQPTTPDELSPKVIVRLSGANVIVTVDGHEICIYTEAKRWLLNQFGPDKLKLVPSEMLYETAKILFKTTIPGAFWKYRYEHMLASGQADTTLLDDLNKLAETLMCGSSLERAVERQKFITASKIIEQHGIPVDGSLLQRIRSEKDNIMSALIARIDISSPFAKQGGVNKTLLLKYIKSHNVTWPKTKTGQLATDIETLEEMALVVPCLRVFITICKLLKALKQEQLELGTDNRVRCAARPFSTKTGRNAPSSNANILSLSRLYRSLIQPAPGQALAEVDFCSQDIGIAAALSGDTALLADYYADDIYLRFMIRAGLVPEDANKATHPLERNIAKVVMLGVCYGMTAYGVACRLNLSKSEANNLIIAHQQRYPTLWNWQSRIVKNAYADGLVTSQSGWMMRVDDTTKDTTLKNWPIQAAGADILRKAALLCQQAGVHVIATNHDALMIESDLTSIERITQQTEQCMAIASEMVIGVALKTESSICKFPDYLYPQQREELMQLLQLHGEHYG